MKKFLILLICLSCLLLSCTSNGKYKYYGEYSGETIKQISFLTVNFNGGERREHVIDFDANTYSYANYFRGDDIVFDEMNTFDNEQEKIFIDACDYFGLFDLEESYSRDGVNDGGSWTLTIEYEDGSTKVSEGVNERPDKIFKKCSTYFYDICQRDVLGCLPEFYAYPPNVSCSYLSYDDTEFNLSMVERADFKLNTTSSEGNDLFLINEKNKDRNDLDPNAAYTFCLYTANYRYKEKFQKITVKEYDYNSELTGEREVYSGKWFKQIEFEITTNKIYMYELTYQNGDFVQYTFNTACAE